MQVSVQTQKHVMFGDVDGREKYFVKCSVFDDDQKGGTCAMPSSQRSSRRPAL